MSTEYKKDSEKMGADIPMDHDALEHHSIAEGQDLLGKESLDPALKAKMHIVNNVSEHFQKRQSLLSRLQVRGQGRRPSGKYYSCFFGCQSIAPQMPS
jgi:hypothetical protein